METSDRKRPIGKNPDFLRVWVSQLFSSFGDRMAQMAFLALMVSLYARTSAEMARISFFALLPSFLMGALAGSAADRFSRKTILIWSSAVRAAIVIALIAGLGRQSLPIELIYALIFLLGMGTAFFVPARLAVVPGLVSAEELQKANALSSGSGMIATLVATFASGILIQRHGFLQAFYVNAGLYLAAAAILLKLRAPKPCELSPTGQARGLTFREALRYLKAHSRTRELILLSTVLSAISSFFYITLTSLAMDTFGLGAEGVGRLLGMLGVGMIVGSVLAGALQARLKTTHVMIASFLVLFVFTVSAGAVRSYGLAWVWLLMIGAANAVLLVVLDTTLQKITPDRFRGKVFGFRGVVTSAFFLLSLLAVGELLKSASPYLVLRLLAVVSLMTAVWILWTRENFAHRIFRSLARLLLMGVFSLRIEGEEFVKGRSRVILAGNHTGYLDGPILFSAYERPVKFLVAKAIFSWPVVGFVLQRMGAIPVVGGKGALALGAATEAIRKGQAVTIFPEGKLTRDGRIDTFRKGVARLHKESGAPIIPFVIHGGYEAWPWNRFLPRARKLILQFGQSIRMSEGDEASILREVEERVRFMKEALERREVSRMDDIRYAQNALDLMQAKSDTFGARTALLLKEADRWNELSYIELSRRARDLSDAILEGGFARGGRIAILSEARPEWGVAFFASVRSGAITVPLDVKLTDAELRSILSDAQPEILIVSSSHSASVRILREAIPSIRRVILLDGAEDGLEELSRLRASCASEGCARTADETALIIYTSGTTGNPKGVMISFANLFFEVRNLETMMGLSSDDMFLSILPLNHLLELTAGFLGVLHAGGRVCYSQSLHPQEIARAMKEKRVSFMITVPLFLKVLKGSIEKQVKKKGARAQTAFQRMLGISSYLPIALRRVLFKQVLDQFGGRLRGFVSGGAPLDVEVGRFFELIGIPVYQGYGLTETSPVITANTPGHNRLGSVGKALAGAEVRILSEKTGEEGEIVTRGPHVMKGYYRKDDLTREVIDSEGWFHTGDLGKIDRDGYLYITGRIKNLIVLGGGKKIHPEEVESVLSASPLIREVCVMSRVLKGGLKDGTEEVCAVITPADDLKRKLSADPAAMLAELVKDVQRLSQDLATYKRPGSVLVYPDEMPKTATRKIKRPLIAEWLKSQAGA